MSTSSSDLYSRFDRKLRDLGGKEDLVKRICASFPVGSPINTPHYELRSILVDYKDVEEMLFSVKKRIEENNYSGAYAIVGEYGTGKTQLGFFLAHALENGDVRVIYRELATPEDLVDLYSRAIQELRSGHHVVLLIDNIDTLLSGCRGESEEAQIADKIAALVQLATSSHNTPRGPRGVAVVLLVHGRNLTRLCRLDERLRRVSELTRLPKVRNPEEAEEIALSVLAALAACDRDAGELLRKCGKGLVELLVRWAGSYYAFRGEAGKGALISEYYKFYSRVLRGTEECPVEPTKFGELFEVFVSKALERSQPSFRVEGAEMVARITHRASGPDLDIRVYAGRLPLGHPQYTFYGEVKVVKDSLSKSSAQLCRYAEERPLLLIVLAENEESVEKEVEELGSKAPITGLVYPRFLLEPLVLMRSESDALDLLSEVIGKDLASDIAWKLSELVRAATKAGEIAAPSLSTLARELISAAKLRKETSKQVKVGNVAKVVGEIAKKYGLPISDPERFATALLEELETEGFVTKHSSKIFYTDPKVWREKGEEPAVKIVEKVLREHTSVSDKGLQRWF